MMSTKNRTAVRASSGLETDHLNSRHHIDELQSLRGAAALMVAISHLSSVYALPPVVRIAVDSVFNAHACIIVFFVLSGYVLTGSLIRRGLSWPSVRGFYIARLFRLFPALWVASAISALLLFCFPQLRFYPAISFWFYLFLHQFPSAPRLLLAALAIDNSLIMPVWTIFIEFMGSAIMPLLVTLALARARLFSWVLLGMGLASYLLAHAPHRLDSLGYMFDFALGAWLACRNPAFLVNRSTIRLLAAAVVLIFFRFAWFTVLSGHAVTLYDHYNDPLSMLVEGIAAVFVVGVLASEHGSIQLLRSRLAVWLGNVSYSLYLIHFPVAIFVAKVLGRVFTAQTNPIAATGVLMVVSLSVSLGLASLMYRFVEIPSIALGKRLTSQLFLNRVPLTASNS
jgi:peptidoglycan/LPS O-acetylase OafA/YrhL